MEYGIDASKAASQVFAQNAPAEEGRAKGKRLILMRHGDPDNDAALMQQVSYSRQALLDAIPDLKIDSVLFSPVKRTVRTAGEFYKLHANGRANGHGLAFPFERQEWLADDSGGKIGYEGLLQKVQELNNDWTTVLMITHSTTAPLIAKSLRTDADDMTIVTSLFDYASILVLDMPVQDWAHAGKMPTSLSFKISPSTTADKGRDAAAGAIGADGPPDVIAPS